MTLFVSDCFKLSHNYVVCLSVLNRHIIVLLVFECFK